MLKEFCIWAMLATRQLISLMIILEKDLPKNIEDKIKNNSKELSTFFIK